MADLETLRHSTSHVMAQAVKELFPSARLGIGPAIEEGFYYDFDIPNITLTPEDLIKIEDKMQQIIKEDQKFERKEITKEEAVKLFKDNPYKLELIRGIPDEKVSIYKNGSFIDLCRGPHLNSTGEIKAYKLLSVAGAYWKGLETNPVLQRIYGTAFETKKELDDYVNNLEEAKKRDHRKLGKELDLYSIHEEAGAGFVYYHPNGAMLRYVIEEFLRKENLKRGYELVNIPHIAKINLFQRSGHTEYYKENMYFMQIDKQDYVIKPMNCPGHVLIYERKLRSYRDLPIRYFEFGTVYRYEKSGVLHGLLRVRGFTQDDAHIFCRPDQLEGEIISVLEFVEYIMRVFGFDYVVNLSTRPDKFAGSEESWAHATVALEKALKNKGIKYEIDPGAGVFYGPKIDIKLKDAIGRQWQGPTIQVDFNNPERFNLSYIDESGKKQLPVMIHRAVLGSLERFIGALIEHYAGAFPLWLAPVQAIILPIADRHMEYAQKVAASLREKDLRVQIDGRREKIGHKIREAELQKIPYMLVIGDKEVEDKNLSVRSKSAGDLGKMSLNDLALSLLDQTNKKIDAKIQSKV